MKYCLFIIILCLSFVGCAITGKFHNKAGSRYNSNTTEHVTKPGSIKEITSGMIYGNFQTEARLRDIQIYKLLANDKVDLKNNITTRTFSNGNFIVENLKPGFYIISSVRTRKNIFNFKKSKINLTFFRIQIREGETVYAGSFEVLMVTTKNDKEKILIYGNSIPTEKNILKHVRKVERNSIWAKSLNARIRKLI